MYSACSVDDVEVWGKGGEYRAPSSEASIRVFEGAGPLESSVVRDQCGVFALDEGEEVHEAFLRCERLAFRGRVVAFGRFART